MAESESVRLARDLHVLSTLARRVLEPDGARNGPSVTQVVVLRWLDAPEPRRAQDVARFLGASPPAATQLLARLRKQGFVRSKPNADDRRAEDLFVTPRARAAVARHEARLGKRLAGVLAKLPGSKRRLVVDGIGAALEALQAAQE